jgi:N-acetylmuramoyl-L-alanine amidase
LTFHYTGLLTPQEAIDHLCNPQSRVSAHYVIDEEGQIFRLVEDHKRAWHAGVSSWGKYKNINDYSIGIEICNPGHQWGYKPFPQIQMNSLINLCHDLQKKHSLKPQHIVGHSDIAPLRKQDPGELFDWKYLAQQGIGLWNDTIHPYTLHENSLEEAQDYLQRIGYDISSFEHALTAFQRRFLPLEMTGQISEETLGRLQAIAELYEL